MTRRVDPDSARLYVAVFLLAFAATGCATSGSRGGVPDAAAETRLEAATAPAQRAQVFFDWNMTDRDARFSGRGVLRLDEGYRARVDLFGPRGETLAAAIVDGEEMRVVPDAAAELLPPAAFMWAALGVFRRPPHIPLSGTDASGTEVTLVYARDEMRWSFSFDADRLRSTEWTDGSGRRTVELTGATDLGLPQQAVFRDWTAFRELTLRVTDVEEKAAFEPDVWILPGER